MATHREHGGSASSKVWLLVGLWAALLLFGAHFAILFGQDYVLSGLRLDTTLWNLKRAAGPTLAASLAVGFASASLLYFTRHRSRLLRVLALVLVASLFAGAIAGLGFEPAARIPDTSSGNGAKGWIVIDTLAVGIALVLFWLVRHRRGVRSSTPVLALPGVALLVGVVGLGLIGPPPIQVRQVVRSLIATPLTWEVVEAGPSGQPRLGTLTPKNTWRGIGGDRASVIVPTGGEISFEVTEEDGFVALQTAVGINEFHGVPVDGRWPEVRFTFEILVNGILEAKQELYWGETDASREYGWSEIGERAGIQLRPGDRVNLRTRVAANPPDPRVEELPWLVGFSDPLLVKLSERPREESSPERPNIVLVVMDTLRRDRLGCYGYEKDTTPNIDRLASRGTLYEHASATSSWTWPSTASILTGMTPERHGVTDESSCHLAWDFDVLAEALQREGYTTAAFSGNALISPSKHFDQGFESYFGGGRTFHKSRVFVPDAIEWMQTYAGQRFFLYLHLVDPHHPHQPRQAARDKFVTIPEPEGYLPTTYGDQTNALRRGKAGVPGTADFDVTKVVPALEQERLSELYDACVATGDYWFGQVVETIEDLGLERETIIAFTADHGEEFFDHGMLEHGHSLFGELVDIPLILAGPGIPAGVRSEVVVSNRNLGPTLARLGGSELRGIESPLDLSRPAELEERTIGYSTEHGWWNNWYREPIQGLREGQWILHYAPTAGEWRSKRRIPRSQIRLYDVATDPKQLHDLAPQEPERAAAMLERLEARLASERRLRTSVSIGAGDETLEMLQGIGYIDDGDE